ASPVIAYLYLGVIDEDAPPFLTLTFQDEDVELQRVGSTSSPCWFDSAARFDLYRGTVSPLLAAGVNGDYHLAGVPSDRTLGDDPWDSTSPRLPLAEGASLVVVYSLPELESASRVTLHEGPASLTTHLLVENPVSLPPQSIHQFRSTRIGGDGQTHRDGEVTSRFATFFGDGEGAWLYARGPGSPLDPSYDWQGADGGAFTQLWDTQTLRVHFGGASFTSASGFYEIFYFASDGLAGGTPWYPPPILDPRTFEPSFEGDTLVDCVAVAAHVLTTR
ncbi:MAG: hypothetical protein KDD47_25105, partial [Acidobacteria bacterium]|nr:hypothetical protein [Acidobacteriota bacterium]